MPTKTSWAPVDSFGLPKSGARYIESARANVSRRASTSPGVSILRFPSPKMGFVVVPESRSGEFPSCTEMEDDPDVAEYYDQPPKLKLIYDSASGRRVGVNHTPDALKYNVDLGWIIREVKLPETIASEAEKSPNRYCQDSLGNWISPPADAAAKKIGMSYELFVPDEKDNVQHRNYNWLEDYFFETVPSDLDEQLDIVRSAIERHNGRVRLADLIVEFADPAHIYRAVALNAVYFNKRRDLLCRPGQAWIYVNEATAIAWSHVDGVPPVMAAGVEFYEGNRLRWESDTWTIRKVTSERCVLQSSGGEVVGMMGAQIITLIDIGDIEPLPRKRSAQGALHIMLKSSHADLKVANRRMDLLRLFWAKDQSATKDFSAETLRRWTRNYRKAEAQYGRGYLGLIPGHSRKGNRTPRLSETEEALVLKSLKLDDRNIADMGVYQAYALYTARCEEDEIDAACYETYLRYALKHDVVERVEAKKGKRVSYKYKGPLKLSSIPTHGDRPFEVAHADHTLSEVSLRSKLTGEILGRPWMSILVDGNTGKPLARYYSFAPPSRVTLMMLLRDCVQRHNRLPQRIVVDQGSEFNSIYFEQALAAFMVTKCERPDGESRFGSRGERINSTIDTQLLGVLLGNTKNMKNVREVYKTHDPEKQAVWTPDQYIKRFDEYIFDVNPEMRSWGLHETPQNRFERLVEQAGSRPGRYIPYDELFHIMTMLEPPNDKKRQVHHYGVSINHIRYWAPELQDYVANKKKYSVRFDPINMAHAYIYLEGEWIEMHATSPAIQEYMEMDFDDGLVEFMALALNTSREYRSAPIVYAKHLLACKRDEEFLTAQRDLHQLDVDSEVPPDDECTNLFFPPIPEIYEAQPTNIGVHP